MYAHSVEVNSESRIGNERFAVEFRWSVNYVVSLPCAGFKASV